MSEQETINIIEEQIEYHQNALDKANERLEDLTVTYSIGDRFRKGTNSQAEKFILVGIGDKKVVLVSLRSGLATSKPFYVRASCGVRRSEFLKALCHFDNYVRYRDSQKQENPK